MMKEETPGSDAPAKQIIFESHNLTLKSGTGIATYARNLAAVAKAAGYRTGALFGTEHRLGAKDPVINEIRMFDSEQKRPLSLQAWLRSATISVIRDPGGVRPQKLERSGLVIDPGSNVFSPDLDESYALQSMIARAKRHFQRYGRMLPVHFPSAPDVFHTTHPVPMKAAQGRTICTVHDLVPLRLPYTTLDDKRYFYRSLKAIIRDVDHIITVSEYSRQDLIRYFAIDERRITNTYQSSSFPEALLRRSNDEVADELDTVFHLSYGEYFLFVGAIEPKKNVSRLIEAYVGSGSRVPLILVGALGWQYDGDVGAINDEQFLSYVVNGSRITPERRVRHLSYVSRRRLVSLMRGARALLFPSLYEGFGLPVLEAMQLGVPVMTSDRSSLPEIAGGAALLVDPYDVDAMSRAIRRLDHEPEFRAELAGKGVLRAAHFAPDKYAERLAGVYRAMTS